MGATTSKTSVNNKIKDTLSFEDRQEIQQTCVLNQNATNEISVSGVGSLSISGEINMKNTLQAECEFKYMFDKVSKKEQMSEFLNDMFKKQSNSGIFSFSSSTMNAHTYLEKNISTFDLVSMLNQCIQNVDIKNVLKIADSGTVDISGTITMENNAFNKCVYDAYMQKMDELGILDDYKNKVEEDQSITGFFDFKNTIIVGIVLVLVILMFILKR